MNRNRLKISALAILCLLVWFGFILGCKNAVNPLGPYDVPTATSTITSTATSTFTITPTSTQEPVTFSVVVLYNSTPQPNVTFTVADSAGVTLGGGITGNGVPGTYSFIPSYSQYGNFYVNVPNQSRFGSSSVTLNILAPGNFPVNFSCSNPVIINNSVTYSSGTGVSYPVSLTYSSTGNLNVPVSIVGNSYNNGLSWNSFIFNTNTSGNVFTENVTKSSCVNHSVSFAYTANDFLGNNIISNSFLITPTYQITASLYCSEDNSGLYYLHINDNSLSCSSGYLLTIINVGATGIDVCPVINQVMVSGAADVIVDPTHWTFPLQFVLKNVELNETISSGVIPYSTVYATVNTPNYVDVLDATY
jgi:hypothetical protein